MQSIEQLKNKHLKLQGDILLTDSNYDDLIVFTPESFLEYSKDLGVECYKYGQRSAGANGGHKPNFKKDFLTELEG